jgi:LPXTG-motif cell wall-anchored protein
VALGLLVPRLAEGATTFNVTNQSTQAYIFNAGSPNPTLTLARGQTYIFNVAGTGHPFNIVTTPGLPLQDSNDPGITGQGATSTAGPLTFTPSATTASTLFYQCGNHTPMTGQINIVASAPVPATGWWATVALGLLVLGAGLLVLRRRRTAG